MDTPEFLLWSLECRCPVRGFVDGRDPERTERQLRAARAVSDARREGRVMGGFCLDPPDGFRLDDALAIYGGLPAVETACGDCPANPRAGTKPRPGEPLTDAPSLAGCYGCVALPSDEGVFHAAMQRAIESSGLSGDVARLFLKTSPAWYGLWAASPLSAEQCRLLLPIVSALATDAAATHRELAELHAGLLTSLDVSLPLHVRLYPRGRVEGVWWRLARHCPRCQAPWQAERSRHCQACGYAGHPAPDRKRHARGKRPYRPLSQLLSPDAAAALVDRLRALGASSTGGLVCNSTICR